MSIIYCNTCAKHIDTDVDLDNWKNQDGLVNCNECAELLAFNYQVKAMDWTETNRVYDAGWVYAYNKEEAINKLCDKYYVESDEVEVDYCGVWSEVYKKLCKE